MLGPAPHDPTPMRVFCSYSSKDEVFQHQLKTHVATLERQGLLTMWRDSEIEPGDEWDAEIRKQLDASQIILLLLSPDFLESKYIWEKEVHRAMQRHEERTASVIPIIVRPCDWKHEPLINKLQALPKGVLEISRWEDRDQAWQDVVDGLRRVVASYHLRTFNAPEPLRPENAPRRRWWRLVAALTLIVLLAIAAWNSVPWSNPMVGTQLPTPRSAEARLIIDARPWAYIDSVASGDGKLLLKDAETPLSVAVPEGRYTVALRGPNDEMRTQNIYVRSDTPGRVIEEFPLPSAETYRAVVERAE